MEKKIYIKLKRGIDIFLSSLGLIVLSPFFLLLMLAIKLDSKGPVFFCQKRVGIDKTYFYILKFRTMKIDTPKDMPTHMLQNPEQYITKIGKFLRKTSLDELPQIINILKGDMSIIGPRPALWNQEDLIAEREKYGANEVLPGLTGWAQINGRDELEITEKAKLDGEYVKHLRQGGIKALFFDAKCFFGTIKSVFGSDGVVEGGTGELHKNEMKNLDSTDAGFEDYGYKKVFHIDHSAYKRILITGANSYIGESFEAYAKKYYGSNFLIDTIDMVDGSWRKKDFSVYDAVFHVAGIAHADVGNVDEETKKRYYAVNTELAIETAKAAKNAGVKQFVFMSSMIVYGESATYGKKNVIDEYTVPNPANFYGDSKWQADKGVRKLENEKFHVAVLRPPMIYGRGSKGNYPVLAKMAKKLPVFPAVENQRSMLYIDNLCEFLCLLMLSGEGGIYFPQNEEYSNTSKLVAEIGAVSGKKIKRIAILNPMVKLASYLPNKIGKMVNKAFGDSVYSQKLSEYKNLDYRVCSLKKSIRETERDKASEESLPSILILVNHDVVIYNFRLEMVKRLLEIGYEVHVSSPYGERIDELITLGVKYHNIDIDRHGMNPAAEMKLLVEYKRLIAAIHPMVVLTYTIKPNIYGGIAARRAKVPFIANITGLGTAIEDSGIKKHIVMQLYKVGIYHAHMVFFQNNENQKFMLENGMITSNYALLPGSGVNLKQHCFEAYPRETDEILFTTIGRIMKDKGINELLEAAKVIKERYPKVRFRLIGFFEDKYEMIIKKAVKDGVIEYIEQQMDIHPFIAESYAVIHPSYHEGMSNVLLESAATGRPILASNVPGCRDAFDEGISGIGFKVKDSRDLVRAIEQFINLTYEQKRRMGRAGRKKMEQEFDREIVINKYIKEIKKICEMV